MWSGTFIVLIVLLAGGTVQGQAVRDSAGIRITTSRGPSWAPGEAWTVSERPVVQLGAMDGAPHELFSNIEAVALTSNDQILVVDRGSSQVRLFSDGGRFLESFGRRGEGPGEFLWLAWAEECVPGSLLAHDALLDRVTVGFGAEGESDTWHLRDGDGTRPPHDIDCAPDGLVGMSRTLARPPGTPGMVRWPNRIERLVRGSDAVLIAEVPGDERYFDGVNLGPLALGRRTVMSANGDWIAVGPQDGPEILWYHVDSRSERRIRWSDAPIELSRSDAARYIDEVVARAESDEQATRIRGRYREYPFPETMPAYGEILFDEAGNLWVEKSKRPAEPANDWMVFAGNGVLLGTVVLPDGFRPHFIDENRVAGVWRDEYEVELVWVLELLKKGSR